MAWQGDIILSNHAVLKDVSLSATTGSTTGLAKDVTLHVLSLVDIACLPLHIFLGSCYAVTTSCVETEQYLGQVLWPAKHVNDDYAPQWWQTASGKAKLGLLVKVNSSKIDSDQTSPTATEILFYPARVENAASDHTPPHSPPAYGLDRVSEDVLNRYELRAIAICSDLLTRTTELTPPASPGALSLGNEAVFLPGSAPRSSNIIHEPPVRKRKSVNDTFDQAAERRKRARRSGGGGVAAAAAVKQEFSLPPLGHRRTASGGDCQIMTASSRPLSRSPSISSSRPGTARLGSEIPKRSGLSRVQSVALTAAEDTIETKNKEIISRIVMAGMRLYGLSQSKRRKSRAESARASPTVDIAFEALDIEKQQDEEYKLVYHQVYKATCFTFRQHMTNSTLSARSEALRQTVDSLLGMFCNDPLKAGLPGVADEFTPGGRKAFASNVTSISTSTGSAFLAG